MRPAPCDRRINQTWANVLHLLKSKWVTSLFLVGLRAGNALSKFALSLYVVRYLGLSDLGVYGLFVAGVTILPAFAGFGTNDWIGRRAARTSFEAIAPLVFTRLGLSASFNVGLQVLAYALNHVLGTIVPWHTMLLCSAIVMLEHLADDIAIFLMYRGRAVLGHILLFLRAGLWPLFVIAAGILFPALRTLEALLAGWLGGLLVMWALLTVIAWRMRAWSHFRMDKELLTSGIRESVPFFLKDMSIAAGLYLDRFLVSTLLGLEASGVYTFFWSVANVLHNITLSAIFQPKVSAIIRTASEKPSAFRGVFHHAIRQTAGVALVFGVMLIAFMPLILPVLDKPQLSDMQLLFAIVIVATILRLSVDSYNYGLVALHLERLLAVLSIVAVPVAACLQFALIKMIGLYGAAWAYLLTGAIILAPRLWAIARQSASLAKP